MKRESKFRAWHYEEGNPLYKPYMRYSSGEFSSNRLEVFFHNVENEFCQVAVMQYTGLKDKNGKEIYEGDVIKLCNYSGMEVFRSEVVHHNGCFMIKVKNDDGEFENSALLHYPSIKIIGNIYENPELMEASDEKA